MVHRLPAVIWEPNTPELLRQAALECFFVHVRTLIEFLGGVRPKDPRRRDRSAQDTLTNNNWTPNLTPAVKARLNDHWEKASQHLVHFSKSRVVDQTGQYVAPGTARSDLEAIANDVLGVWDQYATESDDLLVPHRAYFATRGQYRPRVNFPSPSAESSSARGVSWRRLWEAVKGRCRQGQR